MVNGEDFKNQDIYNNFFVEITALHTSKIFEKNVKT